MNKIDRYNLVVVLVSILIVVVSIGGLVAFAYGNYTIMIACIGLVFLLQFPLRNQARLIGVESHEESRSLRVLQWIGYGFLAACFIWLFYAPVILRLDYQSIAGGWAYLGIGLSLAMISSILMLYPSIIRFIIVIQAISRRKRK